MSTVRIAAAATLLSALILSSCAAPVATPTSDSATHSSHSSHAPADPNAPFDAQFIDAMIVHHEGAVTMAEEARARRRPKRKFARSPMRFSLHSARRSSR